MLCLKSVKWFTQQCLSNGNPRRFGLSDGEFDIQSILLIRSDNI